MWRRSEGFSLLECIAAFSIWSLITVTLLPVMMHLSIERENSVKETKAVKFLNLKMKESMFTESPVPLPIDDAYTLEADPHKELCITWKEKPERKRKYCLPLPE